MAAHMARKGHARRWAGISMTLAAIVATVTLVLAQRGTGPSLETGPTPGPTTAATVLGEVITRSDLPEAKAATPVTLVGASGESTSTTAASTSTTRPTKPRSTTTVPEPELIPPVTVENTTTTTTPPTTTTTEPSPTTTESTTTSTPEP